MTYRFYQNLTLPQREEYDTHLKNNFQLGEFLIERGMDRCPSHRIQTAMNASMLEIIFMKNEDIRDKIEENDEDLKLIYLDQFMQIVSFVREVSKVRVLGNLDEMTEHWMDNGVVYHIADLISCTLAMSPEELFDKSEAEIRAVLSTNESFAQSDWKIDWIVASRHAMGYERVPLPEKALVEKWNWNCHDMRDD